MEGAYPIAYSEFCVNLFLLLIEPIDTQKQLAKLAGVSHDYSILSQMIHSLKRG